MKYFFLHSHLFSSKCIFHFEVKEKDEEIESLKGKLLDQALMVDEINLEYRKPLTICQDVAEQAKVNAANYHSMYITKDCGCVKKSNCDHYILYQCRSKNMKSWTKSMRSWTASIRRFTSTLSRCGKISIRISRFIHLLLRRRKTMHISKTNWTRWPRSRRTADVWLFHWCLFLHFIVIARIWRPG